MPLEIRAAIWSNKMKAVFKFKLEVDTSHNLVITKPVHMCPSAKPLYVDFQNNELCLWAEVETSENPVERVFEVYGTGERMYPEENFVREYIGTAITNNDSTVFHVYGRKFS